MNNLAIASGRALANVFIGDKQIGDVTTFRGRFIFNPSWDAGPNIPMRFYADNPEEMKMMLAQRGLRVETASDAASNTSTVTMDIELFIRMLEWSREESGDDVDLHVITERMEQLGKHPLTMKDYPQIVGADHKEPVEPTHDPDTSEEASDFWDSLSPAEKKVYLKAHPHSKYGSSGPKTDNASIRQHLEKEGYQSKNGVWSHPVSKNKIVRTPSKTHKHHFTVTHRNGEVTRHKTNSDEALKKMISTLAKKPDTSGIGKALTKDRGSLHAYFGKQPGEKLTLSELKKLAESDHPLARRARLVYNVKRAKARGPIDYQAQSSISTN